MRRHVTVMLLMVAGTLSVTAAAESVRRDGSEGEQRAQLMLRQLSQAKASLEAENGKLAAEIEALKAKLAKAEKELGHASQNLERFSSSNDKLVTRVKDDNRKMLALMEKYRDSVQLARVEKANVQLLTLAVEERNAWIDKCKARNEAMYKVNRELIDRYRNKGFWQTLTQDEPLTGIGEVQVENIAEDYRYKLDDLQVADFKGKALGAALRKN